MYALRDRLIAGLYYATVLTPGTVVYIILYIICMYICVRCMYEYMSVHVVFMRILMYVSD